MSYRDEFNKVQQETYWTLPRLAIGFLTLVVLIYALSFLMTGGNLAIYKFWAPKQREAERQVFRHDRSFVDGMAITIGKQMDEYVNSDESHKLALRMRILDESRQIDNDELPIDEQTFITQLKEGR